MASLKQPSSLLLGTFCRALRPAPRALHIIPASQHVSPTQARMAEPLKEPSYTASSDVDEDRKWIMDMPTRAIAHHLLQLERPIMEHDKLFAAVSETGLFRSHRHFKHCLKMMKRQRRLEIACLGPESVGSPRRKFAITLTKSGVQMFTWYRSVGGYAGGAHWRKDFEEFQARQAASMEEESKGLAEALP